MSAPQCKGLVDGRQCKRHTWDPSGYCCPAHEAQQHDSHSGYVSPQQQHSQVAAECSQLRQLLQTSRNELHAAQDSCKQQISVLCDQLSAADGDLTSCKARLHAAEEDTKKHRLQLEQREKELDKLKGQMQAAHVELEKLKAAHADLAKEVAEKARLQVEQSEKELNKLKGQLQAAHMELEKLKAAHVDLAKEAAARARLQVEQSEKELDKLKGQLQAAHVELEKLKGQLQAAHVELGQRGLQPLPAVALHGAEGGTCITNSTAMSGAVSPVQSYTEMPQTHNTCAFVAQSRAQQLSAPQKSTGATTSWTMGMPLQQYSMMVGATLLPKTRCRR